MSKNNNTQNQNPNPIFIMTPPQPQPQPQDNGIFGGLGGIVCSVRMSFAIVRFITCCFRLFETKFIKEILFRKHWLTSCINYNTN